MLGDPNILRFSLNRLLTLGKEQGVVEGEVGGGMGWQGDRRWGGNLTGTFVLYYMLANKTPIKNLQK